MTIKDKLNQFFIFHKKSDSKTSDIFRDNYNYYTVEFLCKIWLVKSIQPIFIGACSGHV